MACEFCAEAIALDQPCAELLCTHKVHTECLLRQATRQDIADIQCPNCRDHVVPAQFLEEAEAVNGQEGSAEVVRFFWEHEPEFKSGLEGLRENFAVYKKKHLALAKKMKEMGKKLTEDIQPLVDQIRQKVRAAKTAFRALPEQKEVTKAVKSYQLKNMAFIQRWGVRRWEILSALRDVASARTVVSGLDSLHAYRTNPRQFNVRIG